MKKTTIASESKYFVNFYDGHGIFENTDENGFSEIMFVLPSGIVYTIPIEARELFDDYKKESTKLSSDQNFLLKLVAVSNGSVKPLEL